MNIKANSNIMLIGGDARQNFLFKELVYNYPNTTCSLIKEINPDLPDLDKLNNCSIIILPVPFSKDGKNIFTTLPKSYPLSYLVDEIKGGSTVIGGYFTNHFHSMCKSKSIKIIDVKDYEPFEIKNAIATAEGAIATAIINSPINLHGSNCLVAGYGKCGRAISSRLKALNCNTTVFARNPSQLAAAEENGCLALHLSNLNDNIYKYDFIFNTIPSMIFTKSLLLKAKVDVTIIDIASKPGGTDFDACRKQGINAHLSLSLPGLYSPKTSAQIIYKCMEEINESKR